MTFDDMFKIGAKYNGLEYLVVKCTGCNEECTHHAKVEIFDRTEDADKGIHTVVEGGKVTQDSDISRNPSSRREGIVIHFWCETCDTKSVLRIAQHKGVTWMDNCSYSRHVMERLL